MYRLLTVALTTLPALAQATHLVGPGGFAQISNALAVAAPGDTILVQSGFYAPFTASIGVRIVAPQGASVGSTMIYLPTVTHLQIPATQTLYVTGISFQAQSLYPHVVLVTGGGQVVMDRCEFHGPHPLDNPGAALSGSGVDLVLVRCSVVNWGGFSFGNGSLAASDCLFQGKNLWHPTMPSLPGVSLSNCRAQFASCTIIGADSQTSISPYQAASAGAVVGSASDVELVDTTITGGNAYLCPTPAPGLQNVSAVAVRHDRITFLGGTTFPFGSAILYGPGIVGSANVAPLTGLAGDPTGLRVGQGYSYTATAAPSTVLLFGITFDLVPAFPVPGVAQWLRCDPAQVFLDTIGVTNANGIFVRAPLAPLPATALGLPLWFHGFAVTGTGVLASVPVGGLVR